MHKYDPNQTAILITANELAVAIDRLKAEPPDELKSAAITAMEGFRPALEQMEAAEQGARDRGVLVVPRAQTWQ